MQSNDSYKPAIEWNRRVSNLPDRSPVELDVQDGRAEHILSGPYRIGEGGKIEVVNGQLLFTGGAFRIS